MALITLLPEARRKGGALRSSWKQHQGFSMPDNQPGPGGAPDRDNPFFPKSFSEVPGGKGVSRTKGVGLVELSESERWGGGVECCMARPKATRIHSLPFSTTVSHWLCVSVGLNMEQQN